MRWIIALVACASISVAALGYLYGSRVRPTSADATNELFGGSREYNFGEQLAGSTLSHTFLLHNLTGQSLSIKEVLTSCGCTTVGRIPRTVDANESIEIPIAVHLPDESRPDSVQITIVTNLGSTVLFVRGAVVRPMPRYLDFGAIRMGQPAEATFTVQWTSPGQKLCVRSGNRSCGWRGLCPGERVHLESGVSGSVWRG